MSKALLREWRRTLRKSSGRRAVTEAAGGRSRTFRELESGARAWLAAHVPADPAALRGRAVVFSAPNGIAWVEMFLALLAAGAVLVPVDAAEPAAARREYALRLRAGFWWDGTRLIPSARPRRFSATGPCLIKLTSGTTGRPRPLPITAAQLIADARNVTRTMGVGPGDLNYALIPLGHSYGLGNLTIPLLAFGIPLLCGSAPLPQAIANDFHRWRPTVFPGVPALWTALVESDVRPASLRSLRLGVSAGAPLPPITARVFVQRFGRRLRVLYGSSETGGISFDRTGRATLAGGVGTALRGVELTFLPGQRLRVRSAAVFTLGNRQNRAGRGCWSPPDRVMADGRRQLTLLGRRDTMVKIAGRRVNPAEVAARLRAIAGVRDAWVAASSGAHPLLGAVVAGTPTADELRARLRDEIAAWKIPKKWIVLPRLPVTATGKADARRLRALLFPV